MNENQTSGTLPDLWRDTVECWQRLPNKFFFFGLLAAWLALFQFFGNSILGYVHTPSLFSWLYGAYNDQNSDDGAGDLIPFLVIGLFWWKRRELLALPLKLWWPGVLILIFALMLHTAGYAIQQPYFSIAALFIGIFGLMGLAWGREWLRNSLFPFFLFIFSIPLVPLRCPAESHMPDGNEAGERCAQSLLSKVSPYRFAQWAKLCEDKQPTDLSAEQLKISFTV
jgi:Transmembrane exosortase (Exosortase_EpsH)